jgi:hypothetical protein
LLRPSRQLGVLLGDGVVVRLHLRAGSTKASRTAWALACGPNGQTATASLEQLILELRKLTLTAWGQQVLLPGHVLLRGLLRRLGQVLLAEAKQTLSRLAKRRKLLLRSLGLRQPTACQTQEAVLHGRQLGVERVAGPRDAALGVSLELRLTEACRDADRTEPRFFSR